MKTLISNYFYVHVLGVLLWGCNGSVLTSNDSAGEGASSLCSDASFNSDLNPNVLEICILTNIERANADKEYLTLDEALSSVAQAHAEDMVNRAFFSHTNPDGLSAFDRLSNAGISYQAAAENIAAGQTSAELAMDGWMNSPGHKSNILGETYTKIGIGYYQNYWVQVFTN